MGTPLASFAKILATSDRPEVFNGYCGAESGNVPVSAVAPAILLSEIEIEKRDKSQDRPPLMPPPSDLGAYGINGKGRAPSGHLFAVTALAQRGDSGRHQAPARRAASLIACLRLVNLDAPYFISYQIEDGEFFTGSATLGALVGSNHSRARIPRVQVRVGNYDFDNTNYIGSGFMGSRYDVERFPLDDYHLLAASLPSFPPTRFPAAVEAISRKRAALKNLSASDSPLPDFAKAEPNRVPDSCEAAL